MSVIWGSQSKDSTEGLPQQSLVVNRQESLIACRAINQMSTIILGPLAYHGKFVRSILMTRSIGDILGPSGCIPCAELTNAYVPYNNNSEIPVRLILATDGLWDAIDNDTVRRVAAWFKHQSSSSLAIYLARKAFRRREKQNLRRSDITVAVVNLLTNNNGKRLFLQNSKSVEGQVSKAIALANDDGKDKELIKNRRPSNGGKVCPTQSTKEGKASIIRSTDELDVTVHNLQQPQLSNNVDVVTNLHSITFSNDAAVTGSNNGKKVSSVSSSTHTNRTNTPSTESQIAVDGYYQ